MPGVAVGRGEGEDNRGETDSASVSAKFSYAGHMLVMALTGLPAMVFSIMVAAAIPFVCLDPFKDPKDFVLSYVLMLVAGITVGHLSNYREVALLREVNKAQAKEIDAMADIKRQLEKEVIQDRISSKEEPAAPKELPAPKSKRKK
jgi:hypothetical protein